MAIANSFREVSIEVIDEYLMAAKLCIEAVKPDGGMLGYPATFLLLCATDAIGHCLIDKGGKTRLEVLGNNHFHLGLSKAELSKLTKSLTEYYRNPLAHNGLLAPGVYLYADRQGAPFAVDRDGLTVGIRVPVFHDVVQNAWMRLDKSKFNPSFDSRKLVPKPDFLPNEWPSAGSPPSSGYAPIFLGKTNR